MTMDKKIIDIEIDGGILFLIGHIIETDSIIGISPLWIKQPSIDTKRMYYYIYTNYMSIEIPLSFEIYDEGQLKGAQDFRNIYFKTAAAVETILRARRQLS